MAANDGGDRDEALFTDLVEALVQARVGGTYWASQPKLLDAPYRLIKLRDPGHSADWSDHSISQIDLYWPVRPRSGAPFAALWADKAHDCCDPWHMVSGATEVVTNGVDELALVAALSGVPVTIVGDGPFAPLDHRSFGAAERTAAIAGLLKRFTYVDPFDGSPMTIAKAIECCLGWRRLIDANRPITAAVGFAAWKKKAVAPLLWNGSDKVDFRSGIRVTGTGGRVAIWKSRTPARTLVALERRTDNLVEVEDGFIRSAGLGADCVPPMSIVVDPLGIYFDPRRPSEIERLLEHEIFSPALIARAGRLRRRIVAEGLSKYGADQAAAARPSTDRKIILVPGQVEDDRSVLCGGGAVTNNLELLRRVRRDEPEAYIIYKPHPDVEAGHRIGAIASDQCLALADEIETRRSITSLIDAVDAVHVNTSLAGFDALIRGKPVTAHGAPFYAGWGLTRDLGRVPARRTARRSVDELVAATLLVYPRYLDPVTGLPCPAEVLVERLTSSQFGREGMLVRLRRLQGRWKRVVNWRMGNRR